MPKRKKENLGWQGYKRALVPSFFQKYRRRRKILFRPPRCLWTLSWLVLTMIKFSFFSLEKPPFLIEFKYFASVYHKGFIIRGIWGARNFFLFYMDGLRRPSIQGAQGQIYKFLSLFNGVRSYKERFSSLIFK